MDWGNWRWPQEAQSDEITYFFKILEGRFLIEAASANPDKTNCGDIIDGEELEAMSEEALDDIVYELKAIEAVNINNKGKKAQMKYILENQ